MKLIKLDAIDSTNEFLKELLNNQTVENFTVVTAENQTKGKGQMGAIWSSEIGKNLIMSILIKDFLLNTNQLFALNCMVSVTVIQALEDYNIPNLSIKWSNDIMSDNKKIGGILIENILKSDKTIVSIIGLGLNINQTNFEYLPKASSLALICNTEFDKEKLLFLIIEKLKQNTKLYKLNHIFFKSEYTKKLFKTGVPMPFSDINNQKFMGIIQGVSSSGKLQVLLENDNISEFDIKEIQMLY